MQYISYGHKEFEISKFKKVTNIPEFTKPQGGFWGSRVNAEYGWKEWCDSANYRLYKLNEYIIFELNKDTNVLVINNADILKDLPKNEENKIASKLFCTLDFEKLSKQYDAIEVLISEDKRLYKKLYGWDCDSIFVMNPYVIEVIKTQINEKEESM